jgi:hypothetical protein
MFKFHRDNRDQELSMLKTKIAELTRTVVEQAAEIGRLKARKTYINTRTVEMPLDLLAVPKYFTRPREDNPAACEAFYNKYGIIDRTIIITRSGYIIDGYIGFLTLRAHGVQTAKVLQIDWRIA